MSNHDIVSFVTEQRIRWSDMNSIKCPVCQLNFSNVWNMTRHKRFKHEDARSTVSSENIQHSYNNDESMNHHIKLKHEDARSTVSSEDIQHSYNNDESAYCEERDVILQSLQFVLEMVQGLRKDVDALRNENLADEDDDRVIPSKKIKRTQNIKNITNEDMKKKSKTSKSRTAARELTVDMLEHLFY